jgi:hypothetical protein
MQRTDYGRIAILIVLVIVLYYVFRILEPFLPALAWAAILATVFGPLTASAPSPLGERSFVPFAHGGDRAPRHVSFVHAG